MSVLCRIIGHKVPMRGETETYGSAKFETVECARCGVEWNKPTEVA